MSEDAAFPRPPDGMLSEQIDLPDHRIVLGLVHRDAEREPRIVVWDGERFRHLTAEAARDAADWYDVQPEAAILAPVSAALRTLANRADAAVTRAMFRRAGQAASWALSFAEMPVEGNA